MRSTGTIARGHGITYALSAILIFSVGIVAYLYVDLTTNTLEYQLLVSRAQSIATLIDEQKIANLYGDRNDLTNPAYQELKKDLEHLQSINDDIRFIYLMGRSGDRVYFLADSEPETSEDYSPPGQTYTEASPELVNGFDPGVPFVLETITDRWGEWISALAPIRDADGSTIALVGLDKDAATHRMLFWIQTALVSIATFSLVLVTGILYNAHKKDLEMVDMKSDFVAAASHELRSPLTSIRWTLSKLRDDDTLSVGARATINEVYERVRGLIDLTNTFLLSSSTDHGIMRPDDLKIVDLAPTLTEAIKHSTMIARMKNIKINVLFPLENKIIVKADAERLRLVFENLLSNAIKYSPQGSEVSLTYDDRGAMRAFSVHDNGIGVPKKDQKTIFSGYQRASNAKKSGIMGSGFGLYMVKKIVDFHGGTITCESDAGQGTTFTMTIPSGV